MAQPEYNPTNPSREEQANSPRVEVTPEGIVRVARFYTVKSADLKTEQDSFDAADTDSTYGNNVKFSSSSGQTDGSGWATLTVNYEGGLANFVEKKSSPQIQESSDREANVIRTYVGPPDQMEQFLTSFTPGKPDADFPTTYLHARSARVISNGIAEVSITFKGTVSTGSGGGPGSGTSFEPEVTTAYIRESVQFQPWSQGGFSRGPVVVGHYYSETVTVSYLSVNYPQSPGFHHELTDGSNTFIFEWNPSSFDPNGCPHGLEKRKLVTNFSVRNVTGSALYRATEVHQWKITAGRTSFDPGG